MNRVITKNTLVDLPRLHSIMKFYNRVENLPGHVAEVGVYKGGTAYLLCQLAEHKHVYLFDTFEGMPDSKPEVDNHKKGEFGDTSLESVKKLLKGFDNFSIYKGVFPQDTGHVLPDQIFSLVHLDCDIYDSVKNSLEFFYPKMVPGGVIILDDYNEPNCPGAKLATDEFMKSKPDIFFKTTQSQAVIIKYEKY